VADLSPWLDWLVTPLEVVRSRLGAQEHRRFIKTHTPLDGVPLDPQATYVVVARHPLDAAVSLYHQGDNLDREVLRRLTGQPEPSAPPAPRPSALEWLLRWVEGQDDPRQSLDSLPGVLWHMSDAWDRRAAPNVVLVHYADLAADLEGSMRRLAATLAIDVAAATWPELVQAAGLPAMRARAERLAPGRPGILKDPQAFFRRGTSGAGRELLSGPELARYHARAAELAPPDLLGWLHRPDDRLAA